MSYTEQFTEVHQALAVIVPANYAANVTTSWVSLANYHRAVAIINTGVITGSIDAKLEQATDTAGTGAKDITGKAITQIKPTDDNSLLAIEVRTEELDVANEFDCIRLSVTPTAASNIAAELFGIEPRFMPVGTTNYHEVVD